MVGREEIGHFRDEHWGFSILLHVLPCMSAQSQQSKVKT